MITKAANRISTRIPHLTPDHMREVLDAVLECLDEAACEEIGTAEDYSGPGVHALDTLAAMLGVPGIAPGEDDDL